MRGRITRKYRPVMKKKARIARIRYLMSSVGQTSFAYHCFINTGRAFSQWGTNLDTELFEEDNFLGLGQISQLKDYDVKARRDLFTPNAGQSEFQFKPFPVYTLI